MCRGTHSSAPMSLRRRRRDEEHRDLTTTTRRGTQHKLRAPRRRAPGIYGARERRGNQVCQITPGGDANASGGAARRRWGERCGAARSGRGPVSTFLRHGMSDSDIVPPVSYQDAPLGPPRKFATLTAIGALQPELVEIRNWDIMFVHTNSQKREMVAARGNLTKALSVLRESTNGLRPAFRERQPECGSKPSEGREQN